MGEPVIYELVHPIVLKKRIAGSHEATEETTAWIEVRRLNGSDMRWLETMNGKPGRELGLVGRLTGWNPNQVDLLDIEDVVALSELISGFLPSSLGVGKTSSGS